VVSRQFEGDVETVGIDDAMRAVERPVQHAAGLEVDLTHLLQRYRHTSLGEISLGPLMQEIAHTSTQHGVRLPAHWC